jgi:WD40 repeat protein
VNKPQPNPDPSPKNEWDDTADIEPFRPQAGVLVGSRYRLEQCLGEGRFGEVWKAVDTRLEDNPIGLGSKFVALKFLKQEFIHDPEVRADFSTEVKTLYQLTHPHLLRLFDFDLQPNMAYLVTEYATASLARQLARHGRFNLRQCNSYLTQGASGLDYAHSMKFVHRDLKPHNLLLTENNRLLIADFGLAHITSLSGTRSMMEVSPSGTPAYMAPEQWDWMANHRSDIYAMGIILFQMLTGRIPFKPKSGNPREWKALHQTAPIPSVRNFVSDLPAEIDEVVQRALAKEPRKRPDSAGELAELFHAAVAAHIEDGNVGQTSLKQIRTNQTREVATRKEEKETNVETTTPIEPFQVSVEQEPANAVKVPGQLSIFVRAKLPKPQPEEIKPAKANPEDGKTKFVSTNVPPASLSVTPFINKTPNKMVSYIPLGAPVKMLEGHTYYATSVAYSPDGNSVVSGSLDKSVRLWQAQGEGSEGRYLDGHSGSVFSVAFSPNGNLIASGSHDKTVRLWNVRDGSTTKIFEGHEGSIYGVAFAPDGRWVVSGSADKTIKVWDVKSGKLLATLSGHRDSVTSLSFSLDGRWLASGSKDTTVKLWDMAKGTELGYFEGHDAGVCSVAISPDGRRLLSGSMDKTAKLWDMASGEYIKNLRGNMDWVLGVAFSPDGNTIAIASDNVRLWDTRKAIELKTITGHYSLVNCVTFSPDGQTLATASDDKTVRVWSAYRIDVE